jgi:antitoxin ParD1/3/4
LCLPVRRPGAANSGLAKIASFVRVTVVAMPTRNVNLTEHFDKFIETGISSGRFSNASEVVREGLRLPEQREQEDKAKIEWLRSAAKEGFDQLDRGEGIEFRTINDFDAYIDQIGEEVSSGLAGERMRG